MRRIPPPVLSGGRRAVWILVACWMAGTAWASLSPGVASPPGTDVWIHALAYGALTLLLHWAFRGRGFSRTPVAAGAIAWGYGVLMEGAQALVPYRAAEVRDLIANAAGVIVAMVIAAVVHTR